jgi:hypothetical protein
VQLGTLGASTKGANCSASLTLLMIIKLILLVSRKQKESFEDSFLAYANKDISWNCLPANGTT